MRMVRSHVGGRTKSLRRARKIKQSAGAKLGVSPYLYYALLLLVIVFFALIRFRLRGMPLERDEGEYAYGGQLLLQGIPLYKLMYTVKLPGTHAAYAVILGIFGQTQAGIHIGLILVNAATTLLVFLVCRRLFGRLAGLVAAASYALLSTSPSVTGFAGHATHFVVMFALGGVWLFLDALESGKSRLFFGAGLLFGLAFLMKQPGLLFLVWAVVYLLWRKLKRPVNWKSLAAQLSALLLGGALPFAVTCLLVWRDGVFHKFWFWTFLYAREYGGVAKLTDGLRLLQMSGAGVIGPAVWIWFIAAVGLTAFLWSARAKAHAFLVISFLLFSFLAVCPGLYFRPHYFILILPAISMLAGIAVSCGAEGMLKWKGSRALSAIPLLAFLLAFFAALYQQREFLFQMEPTQACEALYRHNPFPEALAISNYIRSHTPDDATIAILGSEPEIYFYSHRHSSTGYIYTYPLLEPQKYALTMQKEMQAEIEHSRPDILVLVNMPKSWVSSSTTSSTGQMLDWANAYMRENYTIDGLAEIGNYTKYYWGAEARDRHPSVALNIIVLKRKSS